MKIRPWAAIASLFLTTTVMAGEGYTFTPDGAVGCWEDPQNWSPPGVPGSGDHVLILGTVTVELSSSVEVAVLDVWDGSNIDFNESGSTITVTETASFDGELLGGDAAFVDLIGDGTVVIDGSATFKALQLGEADFVVNGSLTAIVSPFATFSGGVDSHLTVNGSVVLGGGDRVAGSSFNADTMAITPTGSIEVTGGGWGINSALLTSQTSNEGVIIADPGVGQLLQIRNLGSCPGDISVLSGTLELQITPWSPNVPMEGAVAISELATLRCLGGDNDNFQFTGTLEGAGRLLVDGAVVLVGLDTTIASVEFGDSPSRTLDVVGDCSLSGNLISNRLIGGSGTLTVIGTTDFTFPASIREGATVVLESASTIDWLTMTDGASLVLNHDSLLTGPIEPGGSAGGALIIAEGVTLTMDDGAYLIGVGAGSENQGTMRKLGPGTLNLDDAFLSPGLANNGLIEILEGTLLHTSAATHAGDFEVAEGAVLEVRTGTYTIESNWTGEGKVFMHGFGTNLPITHDGTTDAALGELYDCNLTGSGTQTFGTLTVWNGDVVGAQTVVVEDELVMDGQLRVLETGRFKLHGSCAMTENLTVTGQGRLEIHGTLDWLAASFLGSTGQGMIAIGPEGTLNCFVAGDIRAPFDNQGTFTVDGSGLLRLIASYESTNNGVINCVSGETNFFGGPITQGPGGTLRLSGGDLTVSAPWPSLNVAAGLLAGNGSLTNYVVATSATISPGNPAGNATDELQFPDGLSLGPDAACVIEIAGATQEMFDRVTASGTVELDGTLMIGYLGGYEPPAGTTFTILTADTVQGTFSDVVGPGVYDVTYTANAVNLEVLDPAAGCQTDFDGDGDTGFSDLVSILAAWGPCSDACPQDVDGDGIVSFSDLLAVLGAWGPCPETTTYDVTFSSPLHSVNVPPTTGAGPPVRETVSFSAGETAPTVVSALGDLVDQPMQLSWGGDCQYSAAWFQMQDLPGGSRRRIEVDAVLVSGSTLHLSPLHGSVAELTEVRFSPDAVSVGSYSQPYSAGTAVSLRWKFDAQLGTFEVHFDDALVASGPLPAGDRLDSMRVHGSGVGPGLAGIDNLKIIEIE